MTPDPSTVLDSPVASRTLFDHLRRRLQPADAALLDMVVALAANATSAPLPSRAAAAVGIASELGASSWADIRITVVDGHTVRIRCGKRTVRRTYRDLGLHSRKSGQPTRKWDILVAIGEGHGTFRWRVLGDFGVARQAVHVLRRQLREAFGLEGDPFHPFTFEAGWKARFFASSELGA